MVTKKNETYLKYLELGKKNMIDLLQEKIACISLGSESVYVLMMYTWEILLLCRLRFYWNLE